MSAASQSPQRESRELQVPAELAGARADAIVAQLSGLSRTATGRLFEAQEVEVDGAPIAKSRKLAQELRCTSSCPRRSTCR